ncbi:MAG TPA: MXAN_5187 C-terminal domain-containing protein, partial [Polyangiaceae bacterium]|nr:MXAN_5187 C-terminal domain-containing protein [Polyangiaceae bacterium]
EWRIVYEDFIRTKKQCGESTEGLTFAKFQHTLRKNRDALIQRHGCKRVRFSVYVKEGRASLKATPVKD